MMKLHPKDPDIVSQKNLEHMVNLDGVCPQIMQPYIS